MSGARPEADLRFTFHASRFDPSASSGSRAESRDKLTVPSQVEGRFTVLGSGPRTTQMVSDRSPQ
jgi:hypothetical protein